eukprot:2691297-Pleurochrysis_carterae.AAC.1
MPCHSITGSLRVCLILTIRPHGERFATRFYNVLNDRFAFSWRTAWSFTERQIVAASMSTVANHSAEHLTTHAHACVGPTFAAMTRTDIMPRMMNTTMTNNARDAEYIRVHSVNRARELRKTENTTFVRENRYTNTTRVLVNSSGKRMRHENNARAWRCMLENVEHFIEERGGQQKPS